MTARLLLLIGLLLAGLPVQAQTIVRLDPEIPLANQAADAQVIFSGSNATRVTVFVRPVGERTYQSLTATDDGENTWSVALPFDMPPQGIDAYAEYVRDGETRTEPAQSPDLFPYRVPALNLAATSAVSLPTRQYRMVSVPFVLEAPPGLPLTLGSSEPFDVFGDDFGDSGDPAEWRVLRWNPTRARYADAIADRSDLETRIRPGRGFWIVTATGGAFGIERALSTGVSFDGEDVFPAPVGVALSPGWNQIGNPYLFPLEWADVRGSERVEDPVAFDGTYAGLQTTLAPWEGYFVFNPGRGDVTLEFDALPLGDGEERALPPAERLRQRAGPEASVLRVTARTDAATDAVYLGLAKTLDAERPVQLHKPAAVDDGLHLAIADGAEAWLSRFRQPDDATWTLELAMPAAGDVRLQLDAHGGWPDGLAVRDLDRGLELAVLDGEVVVPAHSDRAVRRLRVRAGDASSTGPSLDLGAPWPNPSAGAVTLPYTVPVAGPVRLEVLDVLGRSVRVLYAGEQEPGAHALPWDGTDASGRPVAAGTYLVRLHAGGQSATVRLTRLQ